VESEFDVDDVVTCFEYYGGLATKIHGETLSVPDHALNLTLKEPVGVCGQIVPWNYPLLMAAWKLAPALSAGCTVVLKPDQFTPITALELGQLIGEAGFPAGVVNIVPGEGKVIGNYLVKSNDIDKVAFTGSTEVGRQIVEGAARSNLKKVTLELGGKSANIVFADADWEQAVEGTLFGIFINQGECCSAGSRLLVEESIEQEFLKAVVKRAKKIRVGDGLKRGTKMGPLATWKQWEKVKYYCELARKEGARILTGGRKPAGKEFEDGFYWEPTVIGGVRNGMRVAQEEIFGPVLVSIPFKTEAEAVKLANDVKYGLAGAGWSKDIFKALRGAKSLRAGIVWVNNSQPAYAEAPWGGYKQSGWGRELGLYGIEEYLEVKQVHVNLNEKPLGWYD